MLATFKDFCIDANDVETVGRFWAGALGLTFESLPDGDAQLKGSTSAQSVWILNVPESKSVKHRFHIDVHAGSVDELVALGATIVDGDSFRWTIMADPEGGEFCAFVRDEVPDYRLYEIVVGANDHDALSAWWHAAIGGTRVVDERGFSWLEDVPNMSFEAFTFVPVPETKQAKNRIHLDLTANSDVAQVVADLVDSGATLLREQDDEIGWTVLTDPEGNEFCLFPAALAGPPRCTELP